MSTADDIARAAGVPTDELRASLANAVDHAKSTGMTDEEFVLWIWHAGFITARNHLAEQEPTEREARAEVLNRWATGPPLAQMVVAEVRGALVRDETEQEASDAEVEAAARTLDPDAWDADPWNYLDDYGRDARTSDGPGCQEKAKNVARRSAREALRAAARARKEQDRG